MEKRPPSSPEEHEQDSAMGLVYEMAFGSAKANGVVEDTVSLEEFKKMKLRDIFAKLKEKGVDKFEIKF